MRVGSLMSGNVKTIAPDRTLRDAARMMLQTDIGVLPVAENDRLIGMITDRDIAIRGIAARMGPDAMVRQAMTEDIKYCFEDEEIDHVAGNMADLQIRRLPVMNRDKRLIGIVSLGDLAKASLPNSVQPLHGVSQPVGPHNRGQVR
jgi:CBS domain-containing protein